MRLDAGEDGVPYYIPPPTAGETSETAASESTPSHAETTSVTEDD